MTAFQGVSRRASMSAQTRLSSIQTPFRSRSSSSTGGRRSSGCAGRSSASCKSRQQNPRRIIQRVGHDHNNSYERNIRYLGAEDAGRVLLKALEAALEDFDGLEGGCELERAGHRLLPRPVLAELPDLILDHLALCLHLLLQRRDLGACARVGIPEGTDTDKESFVFSASS